MVAEPRVIDIEPDTDIARLLRDVSESPVILNVAGERFRLQREFIAREPLHLATPEEIRRPPTPEQVALSIAGINRAAGSWKGLVDGEALKAYIRERRLTKNRPPVRW